MGGITPPFFWVYSSIEKRRNIMSRLLKKRGGFTLVELLIVIMIIAILAGMMLLATGSATDTANAARVISDLRSLKAATTIGMLDLGLTDEQILDLASWNSGDPGDKNLFMIISDAMDAPLAQTGVAEMYVPMPWKVTIDGMERIIVGFNIDWSTFDYLKEENVQKKLADQAESVGLYNENGELFTAGSDQIGLILK